MVYRNCVQSICASTFSNTLSFKLFEGVMYLVTTFSTFQKFIQRPKLKQTHKQIFCMHISSHLLPYHTVSNSSLFSTAIFPTVVSSIMHHIQHRYSQW